jgi:hypothetical protein
MDEVSGQKDISDREEGISHTEGPGDLLSILFTFA